MYVTVDRVLSLSVVGPWFNPVLWNTKDSIKSVLVKGPAGTFTYGNKLNQS